MLLPPSYLHAEPPPRRPVYDIPPVVTTSPRWPRLRALLERRVRARPGPVKPQLPAGADPAA